MSDLIRMNIEVAFGAIPNGRIPHQLHACSSAGYDEAIFVILIERSGEIARNFCNKRLCGQTVASIACARTRLNGLGRAAPICAPTQPSVTLLCIRYSGG